MAALARGLSDHGAIMASVAFHGAAIAILLFKLTPPLMTVPTDAQTPAIILEVVTLPTPAPDPVTTAAQPAPPPPEPEPEPIVMEEPPPVIESTVAETVAESPPPRIERTPEHKPKSKPVRHRPLPRPAERPPVPAETATAAQPAPPPPVPAPVAPQTAMAAPAGRAGPPPSYLALLHRALERSKDYPRAARQKRQQGRAMLRFAIDRAGNVLDYRIEKSPGDATLDRAVVAMIERASPLPPIPADMAVDRLEVVVPIPFVLH